MTFRVWIFVMQQATSLARIFAQHPPDAVLQLARVTVQLQADSAFNETIVVPIF